MKHIVNKNVSSYRMLKNKAPVLILISMILTVVLVIFHNYLSGKAFLIFKDIAVDSIQQIWPRLIYLSRSIKNGYLPAWNFSRGIGAIEGTHNIFDYLAVLFGTDSIPYALNYLYVIKVIIAGLFFYKYTMLASGNRLGAIINGFFYAFCSPMMLRGSWRGYPNEIMMAAVLLYMSECYLRNKHKNIFPILVGVFSSIVDSYYAYLYVIIFSGYAFWRIFSTGWNKTNLNKFIKYEIAYFIGFLLSTRYVINFIYATLNSGRGVYTNNSKGVPIFSLEELPVVFMSSISPSFFRVEDTTYTNILGGPEFYCGILTVLLLPQIICIKNKVQRNWYFVMITLIVIYCISPCIQFATTGGRTVGYKTSAFWIILVLLTMVAVIWGRLSEKKVNRRLFNWTCAIVATIYALCRVFLYQYNINKYDIYLAILLCFYCILINLYLADKVKMQLFKIVVLTLCMFEAVVFFYDTYNDRDMLVSEELQVDVFYNYTGNSTNELVERINNNENDLFYRMEQIYLSSFPCDALAYGYHGIKGYVGGAGNSKYLAGFMKSVSIADTDSATIVQGWGDNVALNTLMSVKYILSGYDNGMYGYTFVDSVGAIQAYENNNFLPIGYTYDKYLNYDEFMSIPIENRGLALLEGCVLEDDELKQFAKHMDYKPYIQLTGFDEQVYQRNVDERKKEVLKVEEFREDYIQGTIKVSDDKILFFSIPYDEGWELWVDGEEYPVYCIDNGLMGTYLSEGDHDIELRWSNPMKQYIIVLTTLGIILYICYCIVSKRDIKLDNKHSR